MADIQNAYRLVGVELTEFNIQPESQSLFGQGTSLDYDVAIALALSKENKFLHYNTSIGVRHKGETRVLTDLKSEAVFEVVELSKCVDIKEPDQFSVSQELNLSIGRVAMGITRGLLIAKLREVGIPNVVVPLLPFEY